MLYFIASGLAGLLLNVVIDVFFRKNTWSQQIAPAIIGGVLIVLVSWLFKSINASGWLSYAVVGTAGFCIPYGITWLSKRLGR